MDKNIETPTNALSAKIEECFFKSRFIFIVGGIDDKLAQTVAKQLISLDQYSHDPIYILVSSPGGHVESGDLIHDMIKFIRSPVTVIGSGWVASAGTHIFLAVPLERRFCLPNTRFLIHQPSGGVRGTASDIEIQAAEIIKMRERLAQIISQQTGQQVEKVRVDIERDYWMDTNEAKEYGLLYKVINNISDL